MRKKIVLILMFVLIMLFRFDIVHAFNITSFADSATAAKSDPCTPTKDGCASTEDIYETITGPVYGIRVSIVNKNGTIKSGTSTKNFWATSNMAKKIKSYYSDSNSKTNSYTITKDNNIYVSGVGLPMPGYLKKKSNPYKSWFNSLNQTKINAIIDKLGESNINNLKEYYLKIEPIFVVYENVSKGEYQYYDAGTASEIMTAMKSRTNTSTSYGPYYVSGGNNYYVGGNWNVIRDYVVSVYFSCSEKSGSGLNVACYDSSKLGAISQKKEETGKSTIQGSSCGKYCLNYIYPGNGLGIGYVRISDYALDKSSISLVKQDADTGNELSGAVFRLYTKSGSQYKYEASCTSKPTTGICKFNDLEAGTYYLKEHTAPSGYSKNTVKYNFGNVNSDGYLVITVNEDEPKNIGAVTNRKTCVAQFNSLANKNDMQARIELYKLYGKTNLLDLSKTTGSDACTNATCNPQNRPTSGCLSASFTPNRNFSLSNLSCFTNTVTVGTNMAFCQTSLLVKSNVGGGPFSAESGMLYIKSIDGKAVNSTLTMNCYLFGSTKTQLDVGKYGEYLSSFQFDEDDEGNAKYINRSTNPSIILNKNGNSALYSGSVSVDYYFKKIYSNNGTGEIEEVKYNASLPCTNCKFLGYGKISRLTDEYVNRRMPFNFSLKLKEEYDFEGRCLATVTPKIIIKEKPQLVFRTVNTVINNGKDAFLNKNGITREPGSNWRGFEDIIIFSNNSYNKEGDSSPKYKIILTPQTIRTIREYNKNNEYDDYKFTCKPTSINGAENGDNVCISNYLTTLKKNYGLQINNSKIRNCFEGSNRNKPICDLK